MSRSHIRPGRNENPMNTNEGHTTSVENDILNAVSNWEKYKQGQAGLPLTQATNAHRDYGSIKRKASIARHSSIQRKDFTNVQELKKYKDKRKFIFHRGFFKRNSKKNTKFTRIQDSNVKVKLEPHRFRNRAELESVMNYTDLRTLNLSQMYPRATDNAAAVYGIKRKYHYRPRVVPTVERIPSRVYHVDDSTVSRKNSIKRSMPSVRNSKVNQMRHRDPVVSITSQAPSGLSTSSTPTAIRRTIRRSKTSPGRYRNIRYRNLSREHQTIMKLWEQYMRNIIYQRIQLRITLMTTALTTDDSGSESGEVSAEDDAAHSILDEYVFPLPPAIEDDKSLSFRYTPTSGLSIDDPIVIPEEEMHEQLMAQPTALRSRLHVIHPGSSSITTTSSSHNHISTPVTA